MIIHDIEQNSPEWLVLRSGMPTASEFSKLVTGTGAKSKSLMGYARTLAAEKYAGRPLDQWEGNKYTERGHEMEVEAVIEYGLVNECEPISAGFVTDSEQGFGCSPDQLIDDDGLLEIKSLTAARHIEALQYIAKHGQIQPDYRSQVQGQLMVCEREWCDILFFHPHLPSKTVRVLPDLEFHRSLLNQIVDVLIERDSILEFLNKDAA